MKLATMISKKVLIATVSVAGVGTSFVLIAPSLGISLFGDDTQVADSTVTQDEPATLSDSPAPIAASDAAASRGASNAAVQQRSSSASAPLPAPTGTDTSNDPAIGTDERVVAQAPPAGSSGSGTPGEGSDPRGGNGNTKPGGNDGPSGFEIKGSVTGTLYPTVTNDLTVKIENPYSFAIEIVSSHVTVGTAGTCSGRHLWIDGTQPTRNGSVPLSSGQRIAARGETTYTVTAQLQNSAGDDCQNATFPLAYSAKAVKG